MVYWVFRWLDEYHIASVRAAELLLSNPIAVEDLRERASHAVKTARDPVLDCVGIVAGRGIDLSGRLDCNHPNCRKRQVDDLFRHVWHYFDRIIVEDPIAHEVCMHWDAPAPSRKEWLLSHIEVLLHLRQIGAEPLLEFREKFPACEAHWRQHAKQAGLDHIIESEEEVVTSLLREGQVSFEMRADASASFRFDHPEFEHSVWGEVAPEEMIGNTEGAVRRAAALAVMRRYVANLTSDVTAAREALVPLGSVIRFHGKLLGSSRSTPQQEVAFRLDLPVLHGISTETLIKVRLDEAEHFKRFRDCLRLAIQERIKAAPTAQAPEIAEQIRLDVIEPALNRLQQRLKASERVLNEKTAVGVFLGGLATTTGLLCGLPPSIAISGGIGTVLTTTAAAASKHIGEKRDISLEDLYFLWKAVEHKSDFHESS